ncbi:hypothetical protein D3C78_531150 [compost metagenome]
MSCTPRTAKVLQQRLQAGRIDLQAVCGEWLNCRANGGGDHDSISRGRPRIDKAHSVPRLEQRWLFARQIPHFGVSYTDDLPTARTRLWVNTAKSTGQGDCPRRDTRAWSAAPRHNKLGASAEISKPRSKATECNVVVCPRVAADHFVSTDAEFLCHCSQVFTVVMHRNFDKLARLTLFTADVAGGNLRGQGLTADGAGSKVNKQRTRCRYDLLHASNGRLLQGIEQGEGLVQIR